VGGPERDGAARGVAGPGAGVDRVPVNPSPAAVRALQILDHLAAHDGERFTLSELARDLGMSKATCQAVLLALLEGAYVRRDEARKTYALGPALASVGSVALARYGAVGAARPEMEALSAELGLECIAGIATGDQIVIVARTGPTAPFGVSARVGQRVPLLPPLGVLYVAWSGGAVVDEWIARADPPLDPADATRLRAVVEAVRRRGWSVTPAGETEGRLARTVGELAAHPGQGGLVAERDRLIRALSHEEHPLVDPATATPQRVQEVAAPVFGPDGGVALVMGLHGFPAELTADDIARVSGRLLTATSAASARIDGRAPTGWGAPG
jgi:DNA-binding IclR family transcriptional regulator